MHSSSASNSSQNSFLSFVSSHKRSTLIVTSAIVATGAFSIGVNAQGDETSPPTTTVHASTQVDTSAKSTPANGDDSSAKTNVNASVSTGVSGSTKKNVQLNVNGQDIKVPAHGSTQQTVPTPDGSGQTSVNITSTGNSTASNNSSSSLNVNIQSTSTTTGTTNGYSSSSTYVNQNGDNTFISSN